jgi:hypothetical protein
MKDRFLALSAEITAFTTFDLLGTGMADAYLAAVIDVVGEATVEQLLDAWERVRRAGQDLEENLRREIFGDEKLGPIARNIIKLWYIGTWYQLPYAWTQTFGALEKDVTFVVSPDAYVEGLLWPAIGSHPPGAKAPGYGSWATPPVIPAIP